MLDGQPGGKGNHVLYRPDHALKSGLVSLRADGDSRLLVDVNGRACAVLPAHRMTHPVGSAICRLLPARLQQLAAGAGG